MEGSMMEYHRVYAEINLDAVAHNIREIRRVTEPAARIMAIVKADGYGHGAVEVAKVALYHGADCLGVAIVDEGIQLRDHSIHVPILILGYTPDLMLEQVVQYNLTQTVFAYDTAKKLSDLAIKFNKIISIHIKLDTGMGRIGFQPATHTLEEIKKIAQLPNVLIEGIFTHFASADEANKEYTLHQIKVFNVFCDLLEKQGIHIPIKHAANSAGIMDLEEVHLNMVRPGIILYGLYPSEEIQRSKMVLEPAMTLKTRISYIKDVEEGTSISYGRTFTVVEKSRIATVPVGYADGYARKLSNKGRVLIHGEYAPIVGRICMDQFMVDVSHIPNVKEGDDVVLIGKQNNYCITVEELAEAVDTIHYEIVCMIGKRIPRIYIKQDRIIKTLQYGYEK